MIYDNFMNAGSMPSRSGSPSAPSDHERSGRIVTKSSESKKDSNDSQVKVVFSGGGVQVTARAG
jgi:hypothetical protein